MPSIAGQRAPLIELHAHWSGQIATDFANVASERRQPIKNKSTSLDSVCISYMYVHSPATAHRCKSLQMNRQDGRQPIEHRADLRFRVRAALVAIIAIASSQPFHADELLHRPRKRMPTDTRSRRSRRRRGRGWRRRRGRRRRGRRESDGNADVEKRFVAIALRLAFETSRREDETALERARHEIFCRRRRRRRRAVFAFCVVSVFDVGEQTAKKLLGVVLHVSRKLKVDLSRENLAVINQTDTRSTNYYITAMNYLSI